MSGGGGQRRLGRSAWAFLAGMLTGVVLSTATDAALHATGVFAAGETLSNGLFGLAAAYRTLYGILGSYVTARLAPDRPMRHAMVLGMAGLVASLIGAVTTWNRGPEFGPHWYPVALVVLALPTAWAGGWLRIAELRRRPGTLGASA